MSDADEILARIARVMDTTFRVPPYYSVGRDTSSADVDGWDSLSHALFILAVEQEFGVELGIDKVYGLPNVGALADAVVSALHERRQA